MSHIGFNSDEDITRHDPESIPWRDRTWRMIRREHTEAMPLFLQMNDDGTATKWQATMYGPIGKTGTISAGALEHLEEVIGEQDKQWLEVFITQLEQSNKLATGVAKAMSNGKDKKQ
jgi:hypothetical protein